MHELLKTKRGSAACSREMMAARAAIQASNSAEGYAACVALWPSFAALGPSLPKVQCPVLTMHVPGDGRLREKVADAASMRNAALRTYGDACAARRDAFGHFWPCDGAEEFNCALVEWIADAEHKAAAANIAAAAASAAPRRRFGIF